MSDIEMIKELLAENEQLKARIEFYSRSVKLLDEAFESQEKANFQKSQQVHSLESRITQIGEILGPLSFIVQYPDEESASIIEDLRKDAERYRYLRAKGLSLESHDFISFDEIADYRIDVAMGKGQPK